MEMLFHYNKQHHPSNINTIQQVGILEFNVPLNTV